MILTEKAVEKVSSLIEEYSKTQNNEKFFLRVSIMPGGCSGMRYETFFDNEKNDEDKVFDYNIFEMRIDKTSLPYVDGASMDYIDTIQEQGFSINNPNAKESCGCGDSFA